MRSILIERDSEYQEYIRFCMQLLMRPQDRAAEGSR
jgi:hypothetical protein